MRSLLVLKLFAACAGLAAVPLLHAALLKTSPFLSSNNEVIAPSDTPALQYLGWVETAGGRSYRFVDPGQKKGAFLVVGQKDDTLDVILKQTDDDRDTATVELRGQLITLPQHAGKVLAASTTPGTPPRYVLAPVSLPAPSVVNTNPAPAAHSIEAIAAGIKQRRDERERAAAAATKK